MTSFSILDNLEKKFKKNLSIVLNTFENIMENEAFAPKEQMLDFHNIFKYIVFQRCQKALSWSKGSKVNLVKTKIPLDINSTDTRFICIP